MHQYYIIISILLLSASCLLGQSENTFSPPSDTTKKISTKKVKEKTPFMGGLFEEPPGLNPSPKKALVYSLIFPGAGQVYNKQYLKAPIAAGAVAASGYWYYTKRQNYLCLRNAYRARLDGTVAECEATYPDPSISNATNQQLIDARDKTRKQMEQALFITIGVHLLNGLEAFTAAHLKNFDISDDLSFEVNPYITNEPLFSNGYQSGVTISISF